MVTKKRPQTSYAQLSQDTKDKRNRRRREVDSNLAEAARAKRSERCRLAYAKKANIYAEIHVSKKARVDNRCTELQLQEENNHRKVIQPVCALAEVMRNGQCSLASIDHANMHVNIGNWDRDKQNEYCKQPCLRKEKDHKKTGQVVCSSELHTNASAEMVNVMVDARSPCNMNSEVQTKEVAVEVTRTDEYCMQAFVGGVLQEVSQCSVVHTDEVAVEATRTDEYCLQSCVGGVLQEVSQSSVQYCSINVHEIGELDI
ncbi:hypothetical protein RHMOL_Rhmol04G0071600 [Rhododendron molle]|uniref:Uncharacterized protein n=1 Tax=Rhododendron molle TaxID=49168 RepID=A0ACC0NXZ1_RHOML|nr:hypothetical protein RHMOL_Rhmol04G0071600 [Rhododendron molle]